KEKFTDVECYHCHKKGHTMKFYRQLKKENKKKNYNSQKNKHKKDDDGDDSTEVNTTTDEFFVCSDYDMVNLARDNSSWIFDSGATCHVEHEKNIFHLTHQVILMLLGWVILGYQGFLVLEIFAFVKHVPDMRLNIISTGLLDEDGYHNSSGNGLWKVTLGSLIVAREKRESKLYMTHLKISKSIANAVDNDDMTVPAMPSLSSRMVLTEPAAEGLKSLSAGSCPPLLICAPKVLSKKKRVKSLHQYMSSRSSGSSSHDRLYQMHQDSCNTDADLMKHQNFKKFDTVDDYSDHYYSGFKLSQASVVFL
nr:retrovirus-related Pol polyprotein from transposon TNT 1-94 [Tanacetum cinerariifolium]